MREIEFRGKRLKDGKWAFGYYHTHIGKDGTTQNKKVIHHIYTTDFDYFVDPETVGQYTGLKDNNGKKIYEWDIIKYTNNQREVYKIGKKMNGFIVFDEYNQCYLSKNNFQKDMNWQYAEDVKVIGNIYDNPELLEGRDD